MLLNMYSICFIVKYCNMLNTFYFLIINYFLLFIFYIYIYILFFQPTKEFKCNQLQKYKSVEHFFKYFKKMQVFPFNRK